MDSRDAVIEQLRALVAKQAVQLEQQASRNKQLELALAKAKQDSSTSSKPPSSDITKPKPKWKKARGRKKPQRGAQLGHQRQLSEPLPPERVDETIEYEIEDGEVQRLGLPPTGDFGVIHCYVRGRVWSDGPLPQETFQRLEAVAHVQVPP